MSKMSDLDVMEQEAELAEMQKKCDEHNAEWVKKWPNYCKTCKGWGGFGYTQSHGPGLNEQMFDVCDAPEKSETCHRCGQDGLDADANGPCKHCGWNFDDGLQEVRY